ncbi:glycoside hydrolase [Pedobacter nyackensis]|uniref:Glycosyl hydrolases related to GH101 family, GHL1-GHL3 n=1 Tax=Pedobacter nyackensis TaxID=475255 RepID=A0A1W2D4E4_9SPHI|nr:glycoside hydrolase [Pedobacter nyackensis]SMC91954.1 Glycosyl hydrolases related to GH101 family, GHL1-GHL3 [Pedobacter nyackensis]
MKRIFITLNLIILFVLVIKGQTSVRQRGDVWLLENDHLRVNVDAKSGALTVYDKGGNRQWKQAPLSERHIRNVSAMDGPVRGLQFETEFGTKPYVLTLKLTLSNTSSDLFIEADMKDRNTIIEEIPFLDPFQLNSESGALAIADFSNGHLYPLDLKPFPKTRFGTSLLDMPWVGVCDMEKGFGYGIILETSDDAYFDMVPLKIGDRKVVAPRVGWGPSLKRFGYSRRLIYNFISQGGYVALAKRYRAYAQQHGLIVPFSEKIKKNPNLNRLFGAVDVWDGESLAFAKAAKAAGVKKMIINGSAPPEEMKAINELGYLTSAYDAYQDVFPMEANGIIDSGHDLVPENVVLKSDSTRMLAWRSWDGKQSMKRCPAFWKHAAELTIPKVLETRPYLGRFIDVTTAEDLYECYDEKHPLTRTEKRKAGVDLLGYVQSLGLVTGGEHGRWWSVPVIDYIEGMMSGGTDYYSWSAPYLQHPKKKDYPKWEQYEKWGIGHQYRAPLWELVFHDCVVSTWYWGDSNDFLLSAAPELTAKKDAFNILYGTMPILWANKKTGGSGPNEQGSWEIARETFLRTYRNVCNLHEAIAEKEMLSHEFLTLDRDVQRTQFSDGTQVIVNFGKKPYSTTVGGKKYLLPENGFVAKGPRIEQSLSLVNNQPVTRIQTADFQFTDAK